MAARVTVQTSVDADVEARAAAVLGEMGLSIADAVRALLTRTADEGALPFPIAGDAEHDVWFRARVQEALDDPRDAVPHAEVERHFAGRRARAGLGK